MISVIGRTEIENFQKSSKKIILSKALITFSQIISVFFTPLPVQPSVHFPNVLNFSQRLWNLPLFQPPNYPGSNPFSGQILFLQKMGVACITAPMRLRRVKEWQENDERRRPEHEARMQKYEAQFHEHRAQFKEHKTRFQQQKTLFQQHETRFQDHNAQFQDHMAQMKQWREHDARLRRWRERNARVLEGKNPVAHWFREKASAIVAKTQGGVNKESSESSECPKSSSIQSPQPPLSQFSFQIGSQTQSTFIKLCSRPSSADAIPGSFAWGWPSI